MRTRGTAQVKNPPKPHLSSTLAPRSDQLASDTGSSHHRVCLGLNKLTRWIQYRSFKQVKSFICPYNIPEKDIQLQGGKSI